MLKYENNIPFIFLLQKYYIGDLQSISSDEWKKIANALQQEDLAKDALISKGLELILNTKEEDYIRHKYDFNKLFIGPDTLLAPPYESCYGYSDKTLMQNTTLRVRKAYLEAGLEVINKNHEADDFIAYELDFLLYLLDKDSKDSIVYFESFIKNHLSRWYRSHIDAIRDNSDNSIVLGLAYIFEGVMNNLTT